MNEKDYEQLQQDHPEFDLVTQMQVDEYTKLMRQATGTDCAIGIVETPKSMQIAINTQGPDEAECQAKSIVMLIQAAAGALEQRTQGHLKLMIRLDSGEVVPASPEHMTAVMGRRPK